MGSLDSTKINMIPCNVVAGGIVATGMSLSLLVQEFCILSSNSDDDKTVWVGVCVCMYVCMYVEWMECHAATSGSESRGQSGE
jgi:hypothetical protein